MSKVIRVYFGFVLLNSVIGQLKARDFLNQWEAKTKTVFCSYTFSRALRRLQLFVSNPDWFIALLTSVLIGWSDYFGFGFRTLK